MGQPGGVPAGPRDVARGRITIDIAEDVEGAAGIPVQAVGYVLPFHLRTDIYQFTAYFIRSAAEARAGGEKAVALYTEDALHGAILGERERCAKVCEAVGSDLDPQYADHIASAIRSGETGK